jgi:hypothetical protein
MKPTNSPDTLKLQALADVLFGGPVPKTYGAKLALKSLARAIHVAPFVTRYGNGRWRKYDMSGYPFGALPDSVIAEVAGVGGALVRYHRLRHKVPVCAASTTRNRHAIWRHFLSKWGEPRATEWVKSNAFGPAGTAARDDFLAFVAGLKTRARKPNKAKALNGEHPWGLLPVRTIALALGVAEKSLHAEAARRGVPDVSVPASATPRERWAALHAAWGRERVLQWLSGLSWSEGATRLRAQYEAVQW